jgi:hypothetical protein
MLTVTFQLTRDTYYSSRTESFKRMESFKGFYYFFPEKHNIFL